MRPLGISLVLLAALATAGEPSWPEKLPSLQLQDPLGRTFSHVELGARGAVIVVTAPSLSQGDAQLAWAEAFRKASPAADGPTIALLEDMAQTWFRPTVLLRMRERYTKTSRILVLLDEDGAARKAFGVPEDATIAFAFSARGKLVRVEQQPATVQRARKLLQAAAGR